jgi:hypothetical protein
LEDTAGRLNEEAAMNLLRSVSQYHTIWSMVYDMRTGEVYTAVGGDYDDVEKFNLE